MDYVNMSTNDLEVRVGESYLITDIEWEYNQENLPRDMILDLPNWMTDLDCEDFEPSDEAGEALDARWRSKIRELLQGRFSTPVVKIGGFQPYCPPNEPIPLHRLLRGRAVDADTWLVDGEQRERPYASELQAALNAREKVGASTGRYISHAEDDPGVWQNAFDDPRAAIQATRDLVADRMRVNGAGCGAVLDTATDEIIAVVEVPMPDPAMMLEVAKLIRSYWRGG